MKPTVRSDFFALSDALLSLELSFEPFDEQPANTAPTRTTARSTARIFFANFISLSSVNKILFIICANALITLISENDFACFAVHFLDNCK